MRCYTITRAEAGPGIVLTDDKFLGPVVSLGEAGRGRTLTKVKFDGRRPPVDIEPARIRCSGTWGPDDAHRGVRTADPCPTCGGWAVPTNARVMAAGLTMFVAGGVERVALTAPREGEVRVLLRISCEGCYTRDTFGRATLVAGEAQRVDAAAGFGAEGDAGRLGTWDDALWIAAPGAAIKVKPHGGHKTPAYVVVVGPEGAVTTMSEADWLLTQEPTSEGVAL